MTFDPAILRELTVSLDLSGYLRLMAREHAATPLGMGHAASRFSSPDGGFTLLYVARDLPTAIAERIVRDRYQGRRKRVIFPEELEHFVVAEISTTQPLHLVDLRTSGANRLGVPTDAVRGRAQHAGRKASQRLYDTTGFDGIVYASRITNGECVAIYDRAVREKLETRPKVRDLLRLVDLAPALTALSVRLAP